MDVFTHTQPFLCFSHIIYVMYVCIYFHFVFAKRVIFVYGRHFIHKNIHRDRSSVDIQLDAKYGIVLAYCRVHIQNK